jgi:uncharacterized protein (UPF0548 family)
VGLAREGAAGFHLDEVRLELGRGRATFERAQTALLRWKMFDTGFTEVFPARASTSDGSTVAVLVHHLGFWSLNPCRVVYQIREEGAEVRFGFAYGTLTGHGESGEEIFAVCWEPGSERVRDWLRAASRPAALLARLGSPIARHLQARFRKASCAAMREACR